MDRKGRGGRSVNRENGPQGGQDGRNTNVFADLADLPGVSEAVAADEQLGRAPEVVPGYVSPHNGNRPGGELALPVEDEKYLPDLAYPDGTLAFPSEDEALSAPPVVDVPSRSTSDSPRRGSARARVSAAFSGGKKASAEPPERPLSDYVLPPKPTRADLDSFPPPTVEPSPNNTPPVGAEATPVVAPAPVEGAHHAPETTPIEDTVVETVAPSTTPDAPAVEAAPAETPTVDSVAMAREAVSQATAGETLPPAPVVEPAASTESHVPSAFEAEALASAKAQLSGADQVATSGPTSPDDPTLHGRAQGDLTPDHQAEFNLREEARLAQDLAARGAQSGSDPAEGGVHQTSYDDKAGVPPTSYDFAADRVARPNFDPEPTVTPPVPPPLPGSDPDLRGFQPPVPGPGEVAADIAARAATRTPDVPVVAPVTVEGPSKFGAELDADGKWVVPDAVLTRGEFKAGVAENYAAQYNAAAESDKNYDGQVEALRAKRISGVEARATQLLAEADEAEATAHRKRKPELIAQFHGEAAAKRAEAADLQASIPGMQTENLELLPEAKALRAEQAEKRKTYMDQLEATVTGLNEKEIDRTKDGREHDSEVAEVAAYAGDGQASDLMTWAGKLRAEQAEADKLAESDPRYQLDARFGRESQERAQLITDITKKAETMMGDAGTAETARLKEQQQKYRDRALAVVGDLSGVMGKAAEGMMDMPINGKEDPNANKMVSDVLKSMGYDIASDDHSEVVIKNSLFGKPKRIDRIYSNTTDIDPKRRSVMMVARYDAQNGKLVRFDAVKVPFKDDYFTVDAEGNVLKTDDKMTEKKFAKKLARDTEKWEKKAKKLMKQQYTSNPSANVEYDDKNVEKKSASAVYGGLLESFGVPQDQVAERSKKVKQGRVSRFWDNLFRS